MFFFQRVSEGLGQLEAYVDAEEGVAFQMDNKLIWDCLGGRIDWAIKGLLEKTKFSKFQIILLPSGKVMLKDWMGKFLAPKPVGAEPHTYPVLEVPYSDDASLQFEVFYRDNKVAFRAFNGLFLTSIYRSFYTIEAVKAVADDSCCFRPMIGDVHSPKFRILRVITDDLSGVKCYPCVIMKAKFFNSTDVPRPQDFSLIWKTTVTDKTTWKHLWGLGLANSRKIRLAGMKVTLSYTEDNEKTVSVTRNIYEKQRREIVMPPKSVCTASLIANKCDNAVFRFKALIRKVKSNGDAVSLREQGTWTGLLYRDVYVAVEIEQFPNRQLGMVRNPAACTIM